MPLVATAAEDWRDDETDRLIASIEMVVELRFGPTEAALLRDVRSIIDLDRLHEILDIALSSSLDDIRAAIESALPPPK